MWEEEDGGDGCAAHREKGGGEGAAAVYTEIRVRVEDEGQLVGRGGQVQCAVLKGSRLGLVLSLSPSLLSSNRTLFFFFSRSLFLSSLC